MPVPASQTQTAQFSYTIADASAFQSTATVTVTVTGANDPPVLNPATFSVPLSGASFAAPGVLQNSFDPDLGNTLTVTHVNGLSFSPGVPMFLPSNGVLVIYPNGAFGYTPPLASSSGQSDSFTVTASDGQFSGTLTVTLNFQ
ncbi:MAG: Ig-like domain-containing protein [Xanthomonadales bacterium]|nr:Ig-like domain-containing protein [Xanthomonadales bacterium]